MTETKELYIIAELATEYQMFRVGLDKFKDRKTKAERIYRKKLMLTIQKEPGVKDVMEAFHARGASEDDSNYNNKAMFFFIINGKLYSWMDGMDDTKIKEELEVRDPQFDVIDDDSIVISTQG